LKISQFADGELPIEDQGELFKILSLDEEARKIFNEFLSLKNELKSNYNSIDADLSGVKLPVAVETKKRNIYRTMFYWSAAAALLIFVGASFLFSRILTMRTEVEALNAGYKNIKEKFEEEKAVQNSFKSRLVNIEHPEKNIPAAPVKSKVQIEKNDIPVPQKQRDLSSRLENIYGNYTQVKITKSDFVIPQMAGN
jgi:hypothetical protein